MRFNESKPVALETVIADGKPHKMMYDMIADEADVRPMKLLYPSTAASGYFDHCGDNYGNGENEEDIYIGEIPYDDGSTRDPMDKSTAYGTANVAKFNGYKLEIGRVYHIYTGTDETGETPGLFYKCGADGILDEPAVPAKTTRDVWGHGFSLVKATSATEGRYRYLGIQGYDDSA